MEVGSRNRQRYLSFFKHRNIHIDVRISENYRGASHQHREAPMPSTHTAWLIAAVCTALAGCETPGPQVNVNTAAGPTDVACSVGADNPQRTVRIDAWRGRDTILEEYTTERVCQRLAQVSQGLLAQGAAVRFQVLGQVQLHPEFGPVGNSEMERVALGGRETVRLVVVDAIEKCGLQSAFVAGCTPAVGQPLVFLNRARWDYRTPEWIVWAHELGHTVGLHHPDNVRPPTASERIMTYKPESESTNLTASEAPRYAQLGITQPGSGSGAAVGVVPDNLPPINVAQLIPFILTTGQHGVPLRQLEHLSDVELLTLRALLEPTQHIDNAALKQLTVPLRINALVPLAELGRDQAQAYVRDYLLRQTDAASLDVRRYGLWALGRGQLRHPTNATRQFLQQAGQPGFWCAAPGTDKSGCQQLAEAAQYAMDRAGLKTTDKLR